MKLIKLRVYKGSFQYRGTKKRTVCRMVRLVPRWKYIYASGLTRARRQPINHKHKWGTGYLVHGLALSMKVDGFE